MKKCSVCKQIKPEDQFYQSYNKKIKKFYPRSLCKSCSKNYCLTWYHLNPEKAKLQRVRQQEKIKIDPRRHARRCATVKRGLDNLKMGVFSHFGKEKSR